MSNELVRDGDIDEVQLFMLYALTGGDVRRVAVVSRVDESYIESLARDFHWKDKIKGRGRLDTAEGAETERVLNRITTYQVASRLDRVFSNLIAELDKDPSFARAFCTEVDNEGATHFNTKNLIELAKGLQIVADIKYRALQDKQAEAVEDSNGAKRTAATAVAVYAALANRFDAIPVVDTTAEFVKALAPDAAGTGPERSEAE